VRPLRLSLEGFTSFRDKVLLDFSGLDLFAITGPTGAGKSSLIDALVFALYGQVPRVGDDYKQLISHGKERLTVMLEFTVGRESYRIVRTARPDKPSQQRLERITSGTPEPVADGAREIRTEVDRILGLDYDGFTRSVVLPQGQFDAFLKGEPKERRKILVALLSLTVYERMQQLANQRSSTAKTEADFIKRQLETDFATATPEALEQKKAELEEVLAKLKTDIEGLEARKTTLESTVSQLESEKNVAVEKAETTGAELARQKNLLFYEADLSDRLRARGVLKGSSKGENMGTVKFASAVDLRTEKSFTIRPSQFGVDKITDVRILPTYIKEGRDLGVQFVEDGTIQVTVLNEDVVRGQKVLFILEKD